MTAGDRLRHHYLAPWRVDLTIRGGIEVPLPGRTLARAVAAALTTGGAPAPASIGLILSGDRELARLNRETLGGRGPTDVISFPLLAPEAFPAHTGQAVALRVPGDEPAFALPPGRRPHLGDIVISVERAVEQAGAGRGGQTSDARWSAADELRLLATHGALHICGWDHARPAEEAAMRGLERRLLGLAEATRAARG
ncbi:MAG: rRNA maturation RNase YbeY [Candidatus Limnocylindrales bacterium]